jgi:predicted nucleic acid-binding protein
MNISNLQRNMPDLKSEDSGKHSSRGACPGMAVLEWRKILAAPTVTIRLLGNSLEIDAGDFPAMASHRACVDFADISVTRRSKGRPVSQFDAQIAAIARSTGAAVATRNVDDFEDCGIDLVNPWQS